MKARARRIAAICALAAGVLRGQPGTPRETIAIRGPHPTATRGTIPNGIIVLGDGRIADRRLADRLGSLEAGKFSKVIVTDGDLFDEQTRIVRVFIDGVPVALPDAPGGNGRSRSAG